MTMRWLLTACALALLAAGGAHAQDAAALAAQQGRAELRMAELEQHLLGLVGRLENDEPAQAARLAEALALSRDRFIVETMAEARRLLARGRLDESARLQEQVAGDLAAMAALLAASDTAAELRRLTELEAALADLLARQAAAAAAGTAAAQADVRTRAEGVQAQAPGRPGAAHLAAAVAHMLHAERTLGSGQGAPAGEAQAEAEHSLADALTAVRAAVAALRAQERAAARARLAGLLEAMEVEQESILADTRAVAEALSAVPVRSAQLAVARLAERQQAVADQAAEALSAARETGSTALPAALAGLRADIGRAHDRLQAGNAGVDVQALQEGIVAELRALREAVRKAESPAAQVQPGEQERRSPSERPPPDLHGDLLVLRAVQTALQARTARLDAQTARPAEAVRAVAERQSGVVAGLTALGDSAPPSFAHALAPIAQAAVEARDALERGLTGAGVREAQGRVLDGLDALIAAAEQPDTDGTGAPGGSDEPRATQPGAATGAPQRAADESMLSPFGPPPGLLAPEGPAAADWLPELPEAERRRISDAFATGRLPARYRELLRDYSRRLAGQGE